MRDTRIVYVSLSARAKALASLRKPAERVETTEPAVLRDREDKESKGSGESRGDIYTYQVSGGLGDGVSARNLRGLGIGRLWKGF